MLSKKFTHINISAALVATSLYFLTPLAFAKPNVEEMLLSEVAEIVVSPAPLDLNILRQDV